MVRMKLLCVVGAEYAVLAIPEVGILRLQVPLGWYRMTQSISITPGI